MGVLKPIIVTVPKNSANPLNPTLVNVVKGTISPTVRTISYGSSQNQINEAILLAQAAYNEANVINQYITGSQNVQNLYANTLISAPTFSVGSAVDANNATGYFNTLQANAITLNVGVNNDVLFIEEQRIAVANNFTYDPYTEILHVATVDATIDAGSF
jgi:hypothetical protein